MRQWKEEREWGMGKGEEGMEIAEEGLDKGGKQREGNGSEEGVGKGSNIICITSSKSFALQ